jgi:hypothetical protein
VDGAAKYTPKAIGIMSPDFPPGYRPSPGYRPRNSVREVPRAERLGEIRGHVWEIRGHVWEIRGHVWEISGHVWDVPGLQSEDLTARTTSR